jgi:glycosyltransferase involved in cell wall biosynthesis
MQNGARSHACVSEAESYLPEPKGFNQVDAGSSLASKFVGGQGSLRASVIIPTYYRSNELSELLDSLLGQIVKPMEVIVVDDTPTEVIRHVCEDYEGRFLKERVALIYVRNTGERSITIARNLGVKIAKGDILIFFDSDLILYPDYIEELLETFGEYPEILGVTGWIVRQPPHQDIRYFSLETFKKLFLLFHWSRDRCRFLEYPMVLTKITTCQRFSGSNMAWKRNVFNEHKFDENLKGYAFMEDVLFSGLIFQEFPDRLLMTPEAKCVHAASMEGRPEGAKLREFKFRTRKYVLTQLFGAKGLLIFGWENFGLLILRLIVRIIGKEAEDTFL